MPGFDKFRPSEGGAILDNGMSDGFGDGFSDGFDDDFGNGPDGGFGNAFGDGPDGGFRNAFGDEPDGGFGNAFCDGPDDISPQPVESGEGTESAPRSDRRSDREKVDLKEAFAALFKAISDRFTGNGKPARSTAVDGSDASFASEYDRVVDDGFAVPQEERDPVWQEEQNPVAQEEQYPVPEHADSMLTMEENPPKQQPFDGVQEEYPRSEADRQDRYYDSRDDLRIRDDGTPEHVHDFGMSGYDSDMDGQWENTYADQSTNDQEKTPPEKAELPPEGSAKGVLAAISSALKNFRRRLPSFRPKVYVVPEPEYHPEQDGIGTPTLASDIRRILEEQTKPGETEQEYDKMRQYISSVSTDARLRPGDVRPPENIGEVRAAQEELYDLINQISNTNEQQRSRIGVYEQPPEEDPYNYRGINDNRQFYNDMDVYSFDMNTRYGFESEKKVDPGRERAEREYSRVYNSAVSQQPEDSGGFSDGFDDDFDDGFDSSSGNVSSDSSYGFGEGFDDGFDDDFSGDSGSTGGFDDGFDDDFGTSGDSPSVPQGKKTRVRVKGYENPDSNASYREGFSSYRAKRSAERNAFHRRQNG